MEEARDVRTRRDATGFALAWLGVSEDADGAQLKGELDFRGNSTPVELRFSWIDEKGAVVGTHTQRVEPGEHNAKVPFDVAFPSGAAGLRYTIADPAP